MKKKYIIPIIYFSALLLSNSSIAANKNFAKVGNWNIIASYNKSNVISSCSMSTGTANRMVNFGIAPKKDFKKQNVIFLIGSQNWNLPMGNQYSVQIKTDKLSPYDINFHVSSKYILLTKIEESFMQRLLGSTNLLVTAGKDKLAFDVKGINSAYTKLKKCVESDKGNSRNPFE